MRMRVSVVGSVMIFASLAQAQQVIYLKHAVSPQALQEVGNAVRAVTEIQTLAIDTGKKTLTVDGTAEQIAAAQWIAAGLDRDSAAATFGKVEYAMPSATPPGLAIYYLAHSANPRELQDTVNAVRSITDLQRCFPFNQASAIAVRGTADQLSATEWMLSELDAPQQQLQAPAMRNRQMDVPVRWGQQAQIFFFSQPHTPLALQEIINGARSLAGVQRLFPVNARNAVVTRASAEQVAYTDWLLTEFDKPAGKPAVFTALEFAPQDDTKFGNLAGLYLLAHADVSQDLVNAIRSSTQMQHVFLNSERNALAVRGTGDQVAQAKQLIQERDQ